MLTTVLSLLVVVSLIVKSSLFTKDITSCQVQQKFIVGVAQD